MKKSLKLIIKIKKIIDNKCLEAIERLYLTETLETSHYAIKQDLSFELLETFKNFDWRFFEKLVIDLLLRMGYGELRSELAELTSNSHDIVIEFKS